MFGLLETLIENGKEEEQHFNIHRPEEVKGKTGLPPGHHLVIWHRIQHALNRILSLQDSFRILTATAIEWPQLFKDVTITFLPTAPQPYSIGNFYRRELQELLQELGFDKDTSDADSMWPGLLKMLDTRSATNGRQAHAEIQLWSHINDHIPEIVPFRPDRPGVYDPTHRLVIGVSKMTCSLCYWFFQNIGPRRTVIRSSSLNVYHRWALPDLRFDSEIRLMLYAALDLELSRALREAKIERTETDTDSAPNSAGLFIVSDESSCESSDPYSSEVFSDGGQGESSTESDPDIRKVD